jgi:hypothetical protein
MRFNARSTVSVGIKTEFDGTFAVAVHEGLSGAP